MNPIVRIALPVPLHTLFDYACEGQDVQPGCRVQVPFGRRRLVGVAFATDVAAPDPSRPLKPVERVLDDAPLLGPELLATLGWAARYYQHPPGEAVLTALPATLRSARAVPALRPARWRLTAAGAAALAAPPARRTRLLALLESLAAGSRASAELDACAGPAARRAATARGWIEPAHEAVPAAGPVPAAVLNPAQRAAADAVVAADGFEPFLLDGVTGSGKTEVYLEIVRACLARGRQALVLVPEIALTPQALRRFRAGLGVEVAALHSGLGESERARAWLAAARGEARVVLGTRSAVLAPLPEAGVIVVDEEHDVSYKQQDGFRYHARDLAVVRARALGVPVVLGSATPSLESLANVDAGRYRRVRLPHRAGLARPPALRVVDVRRQRLQHGLAPSTLAAIEACLARDEQVLVFRNRRGYAPVLFCPDCAWSAQCPHCDRALTLHRRERRLRCHHCAFEQVQPAACPACGGASLHPLGEGTERLEDALAAQFPHTPIVRIDRDTTRGRRMRDALLENLPSRGARLLVGTQMLAKGHDLPHLTLVVVVGVDEALHSVDFRASERLGQLVVQVAGRAGRAERPGEVILQTQDPAHPLLATLLQGGYHALATRLLEDRRAAGLPPFGHLALVRAEAGDAAVLQAFLLAAMACPHDPAVAAHGPLAAPMPRRAGAWRGQILLESAERPALQADLPRWLDAVRALPAARRVRWSIDVDPVDLY
jgi:primosomal protein N' (replication factor Y)